MDRYEGLRETVERAVDDDVESADDVVSALAVLRELRDELTDWEPLLIGAARRLGVSWADLAPALGVASRQAAERRYLRLHKPEHELGLTADGRVQAERDRRAGHRAVRAWAQDNSEVVRKLAALVGSLDDVGDEARPYVDVVSRTLGKDDPVLLIGPMVSAAAHLRDSHPELAAQVDGVNSEVEHVRSEAIDRRVRR
ncbi:MULTISPECIES: HSP18 transcriptional regulator [Prauserella salsuginis group]|uniref:HSP18 transcriptional regulator n=2 Tax=Prauserella salsuginis group TaxID=2893672 RepID=A0A839XKL9_9PSEU|nr:MULTISPECIES: HSP18 transcriptional regulator [Prauserella salsuginis group]MBB3662369.1 hypothetical protein [Prauserella sediminis]MCR3720080.1 hypothetical protein [Prauserella flava]MCR3736374.1 hypothetical protein [Prauserella salsuginis]